MKKIKLLLAAMAAMVGLGANAQSWTADAVGEGYYILYNVGKNMFLTRGNDYGTRASVNATNPMTVQLSKEGDDYFIRTGVGESAYGLEHLSGSVYTDQSRVERSSWTFTQVGTDNGPVYNIISAANHSGGAGTYLTASSDNTIVGEGADGSSDYAKWKLMKIQTGAFREALVTEMAGATELSPVDVTLLIADANFGAGTHIAKELWTTEASNLNLNGGDMTNPVAESWQSAFDVRQTITVPNGYYRLRVQGFIREYTVTGADYPVVFINNVATGKPFIKMVTETASLGTVSSYFANGDGTEYYWTDWTESVKITSKSITIGVKGTRNNSWCAWDNFQLQYLGPLDLSEYVAGLADAVSAAEAYETQLPAAVYSNISDVVTAQNQSYSTSDEYSAAITAINAAVSTYATADIIADYARYQNIKAAALAISAGVVTTTADSEVEAATTTAAIDAAIVTLRAAFLTELANLTVPVDPGYIDVTAVMVDNASVRQNTDYWTIEGTPNGGYSWGKCANNECEFYNQNFKFYQTLALTPGTWEFGVTGFHRAGNHNTYFFAGTDQILIPGVESSVVNTMAAAETYFNNGNGKVAVKFLIETAGDVEIGINNQDTQTDKWTIFRDFTLKYYGAPDYTVYEDQWTALVADANTAKTTYANVTGTELTALNDAIDDSPAGSNLKATYIDKIDALQTALNTFNAAAPAYDKYVAYRAETVTLFGEAVAATVDAPTSAAEALVAVQNLNIAQYNKVASDYTFSATGLIGDFGSWTGTATVAGETATPNYLSSEHWSGTTHAYYEQASTGWDSSTGWTIQYQKICTLPAGSYVIKVAARTSGAGVTSLVSCSATTATTTLPAEDARARGINTSGVASWSDSDTFAGYEGYNVVTAPGQTGLGWQWRFLPFTLATETEVTMTFYAEASSQYQWMSIADGELLSTTKLAQDVAYDETATNTITNTIIADVTVNRNVKIGYNTVCLPFTLTANQVTNQFGAGTEVYAFSENSVDANNAVINFNKGDGSITANVPVLVKATTESTSQTFEGVQIVAAGDAKVAGTNFDFVGTYAPIATIAAGDYFIGNGKLYKSTGSTSMNAFRAYIHAKSAEVKPILFIDDEATSIDAINGLEAESGVIYNLAGQRISKMQKGINIVNGKKILF